MFNNRTADDNADNSNRIGQYRMPDEIVIDAFLPHPRSDFSHFNAFPVSISDELRLPIVNSTGCNPQGTPLH